MSFATGATPDGAMFRLPHELDHDADRVSLWLDLRHDAIPRSLTRVAAGWQLEIERPPVQRVEYLFVLRHGATESMVTDPGNPLRVATAFGDHSVLEFPGYRPPAWLSNDAPALSRDGFSVTAPGLLRPLAITLCAPPGMHDAALPLLLVHDGPEFDQLAAITRFSSTMIAGGRLPPHRVALLAPGDRNRWYAALPAYASALANVVVPAIDHRVPTQGSPVLAGASLGALAALHAGFTAPGLLSGLFLQSGSFFDHELDAHESSFGGFEAVVEFVSAIGRGPTHAPTDIGMTCGLGEENLANNRRMAALLARRGNRVELSEVADAHTYTGWRDALDPHLVDLLRRVWT
jgi:enterochelin esterase-like enzyme